MSTTGTNNRDNGNSVKERHLTRVAVLPPYDTLTAMSADSKRSGFNFISKSISCEHSTIFDCLAVLLCVVSFLLSWVESSVNSDSHHWGFMYVPALDLKHGLLPYRDILIAYGYLTTWIQAVSLFVLGDSLKSIGIVTGLFYSLSLFLCYKIFNTFLSGLLSLFSVFLIFLLHPYIIHPWPNYFSYTFQLLSLLLFIRGKTLAIRRFIPGILVGLACLCRYTSVIAILPPVLIYLCYEAFKLSDHRKPDIKSTGVFAAGVLAPIFCFVGAMVFNHTLYDFYIQNRVISEAWNRGLTAWNFLPVLLGHILRADIWPRRDSRAMFCSIIFFCSSFALYVFVRKLFLRRQDLSRPEEIVILVSLVALFGYFNSVHIYQIFRLINGASIGVGVVVYLMQKMYVSANTGIRTVIVASAVALCCLWSRNFLFKATSSVYLPWDLKMLVRKPVARNDIPMFHGKRVSGEYYGFYEEVLATLSKFDRSYYVINYSWDPLLTVLANLKRVQIMPFYLDPPYYLPFEKYGYRNEATKIAQVIASKRAIILEMAHPPGAVGEGSKGKEPGKIAGYKLVFAKPWSLDTAWFGSPGMKLYISVPEETNGVPGAEYLRGKGAVANP